MAYLACIITVEVRTPGMDNVHCRKHAMQLFDAVRSRVCVCLVAVEGVNRVVVMYDRQCTTSSVAGISCFVRLVVWDFRTCRASHSISVAWHLESISEFGLSCLVQLPWRVRFSMGPFRG